MAQAGQTFRVFVSSTFSHLKAELTKTRNVWPLASVIQPLSNAAG